MRRHEALPRVHVTLDARLSHRHAKAYLIAAGTRAAGSRPLGKQAGLPARCPSRGRESDSPRRSLTEPSAVSGGDRRGALDRRFWYESKRRYSETATRRPIREPRDHGCGCLLARESGSAARLRVDGLAVSTPWSMTSAPPGREACLALKRRCRRSCSRSTAPKRRLRGPPRRGDRDAWAVLLLVCLVRGRGGGGRCCLACSGAALIPLGL